MAAPQIKESPRYTSVSSVALSCVPPTTSGRYTIDWSPMARGFKTSTPAQSAGQLNAKEDSSKGRQLRPSTPQLCALGLDYSQKGSGFHVHSRLSTHHSCAAHPSRTGAPYPARSAGKLKLLMITPNSTIQSTKPATKRQKRTVLGSRATKRAGKVCTGSNSGTMRCNTGVSGPLIHAHAFRLHRVTGAGSFSSIPRHDFVTKERFRGCWGSSKFRLRRGVAAFEGVLSWVYEDVPPLVAIRSLFPPASRSTGAAVAVAVDFAMLIAGEGRLRTVGYHGARLLENRYR
jgi:hypothetical protein